MKVLIECGAYHLRNAGDNAMLRVCATRIRERFPDSELHVLTNSHSRLTSLIPYAIAASDYAEERDAVVGLSKRKFAATMPHFARVVKSHLPQRILRTWPRHHFNRHRRNIEQLATFHHLGDIVSKFDLVVATGGGYLTDFHSAQALRVLWTLRIAQLCNVPTTLFGQGIGPIAKGLVDCLAADVVPNADLVGLREGVHGLGQIAAWNVSLDRVEVTGDDALELAIRTNHRGIGELLGFNVRVAGYAGVTSTDADFISRIVSSFARSKRIEIEPLLITTNAGESDQAALEKVQTAPALARSGDEISDLADAVGRCRIIVTGSYHAAVFALAQGVPAIGIVGSEYYQHKFDGLAGLFGDACRVYRLHRHGQNDLARQMELLWEVSPQMSNSLREAAVAQVARGNLLYDRLINLMTSRTHVDRREKAGCA
jgi:polysaccharide pyruvyl transferase WcaK-like protein